MTNRCWVSTHPSLHTVVENFRALEMWLTQYTITYALKIVNWNLVIIILTRWRKTCHSLTAHLRLQNVMQPRVCLFIVTLYPQLLSKIFAKSSWNVLLNDPKSKKLLKWNRRGKSSTKHYCIITSEYTFRGDGVDSKIIVIPIVYTSKQSFH